MTPVARFQILSIDGGGIRGLFAAAILAAIEDDYGVRVTDHFDLVAGTSTGGVIAIGLGLGLRPRELLAFYVESGPRIFSNRFGWRSAKHWFATKFSADKLCNEVKDAFKARRFGESRVRLVVPSFDLTSNDVYVFRTPHAAHLRRDYKVEAWKVAMATTAAPTYFRAFRDIGNLSLVDGGVWANNPAMVAIGEALGPLQQQRDSVSLLSIGTMLGLPNDRRLLNQAGKITWSKHLPDVLLSATARGVDNQARFLLGDERYLRVNVTAPADDVSLDDVDAIEQLIARAHHVSRHALPSINAMFLGTRALQYEPAFNLEYAS